jgi:hypothetical protein
MKSCCVYLVFSAGVFIDTLLFLRDRRQRNGQADRQEREWEYGISVHDVLSLERLFDSSFGEPVLDVDLVLVDIYL